jgi:hypothetical protein
MYLTQLNKLVTLYYSSPPVVPITDFYLHTKKTASTLQLLNLILCYASEKV